MSARVEESGPSKLLNCELTGQQATAREGTCVPISSQRLPLQGGDEGGTMEVQTDEISPLPTTHILHAFLPATATMGPQWLIGSSSPGVLGSQGGGNSSVFCETPRWQQEAMLHGGKALLPSADKCFPLCRGNLSGLSPI